MIGWIKGSRRGSRTLDYSWYFSSCNRKGEGFERTYNVIDSIGNDLGIVLLLDSILFYFLCENGANVDLGWFGGISDQVMDVAEKSSFFFDKWLVELGFVDSARLLWFLSHAGHLKLSVSFF